MRLLLHSRYFIPQLGPWLQTKLKNCLECALFKRDYTPANPHTQRLPASTLFSTWSIELCGKLTPIHPEHFTHFYVGVEHVSGFTVARPVTSTTSQAFIDFLMNDIIIPYSTPKILYLDQQSSHTSIISKQFLKSLDIEARYVLPSRHETLGNAEQKVGQLQIALKFLTRNEHNQWPCYLQTPVAASNKSPSSVTSLSAFQILFGIEAVFPIHAIFKASPPLAGNDDRLATLYEFRQLVTFRKQQAFDNLKAKAESKKQPTTLLPGTKVLVKRLSIPRDQCASLSQQYQGPYTVISKLDNNSYFIDLGNDQHKPFPINRLRMYIPATQVDQEFKTKYHDFIRRGNV